MKYKRRLEPRFDAFQMTFDARMKRSSWPVWLNDALKTWPQNKGAIFPDEDGSLIINTYLGNERIENNDWIVKPTLGTLERFSDAGFTKYFELDLPDIKESP